MSVALLIATTACAGNRTIETTVAPPDLAGAWALNEGQSSAVTNLSALFRDVRDSLPRMPAPAEPPSLARVTALLENGVERFTIAQDSTIGFHFGDMATTLVPDWRVTRAAWHAAGSDSVDIRARWDAGRLRVEWRLDGGITANEYYSRGPGAPYLVLYIVVRGPSGVEASVRRIYDPAG